MNSQDRNGKVYIVGAGPGDPGLMTIKGLEKLKQADVVVYDRLINDDLLSYCNEGCETIFVGKESGYHTIEQEQITEILIRKSKLGLNVVRLKGGNPFVFGRGSEEAVALKDAGIDFEIIPGITSGLSAPIYSGIPITHRGLITQCVLVTAHESPDKQGTQVEWNKLAQMKNTALIIYMGASRIESICNELVRHGMDPSTPSAVIENGTLPKQRTITGRLDHIAQEFKVNRFHAPAIIMISPTVAIRDQISWYENKPLFGKRIAAAGSGKQLLEIMEMIYDLGGEALSVPSPDTFVLHDFSTECGDDGEENFLAVKDSTSNGFQFKVSRQRDFLPKSEFTTISEDIMEYAVEDIMNQGADAFIFTTSSAVEYFFGMLGDAAATTALEQGRPVALDHAAADALADKQIGAISLSADGTTDALRDLLFSMFPKTQR